MRKREGVRGKRKERKTQREKGIVYENVVKIVSVLVPFRVAISRETTLSK